MKKYLLFLLAAGLLLSCDMRRKDKIPDDEAVQKEMALKQITTVEIIDSVYNFGKVSDGEKIEYNFRFKNSGKNPLIIINATATCGCTVPQKPEKPIMPGEMGFIKAVFDSKGRVGGVDKKIMVSSNTNPEMWELQLTGEVISNK